MTFMPPSVIKMAKTASPIMHGNIPIPDKVLMAMAPRYKIEVRLTTTYKNSQNIAITRLT